VSWLVQPRLVNDPFGDPGLFLDFRFGRRAILFDLGENAALLARELMRVSHAFVSHTHMDHFAGFDRLLRLCLHRPGPLDLVGPPGFIDQVQARLASYSWNLLGPGSVDFQLAVAEFEDDRLARKAAFHAREEFRGRDVAVPAMPAGIILDEAGFRVAAATLDHGMPCLAFALAETLRVSVLRGELDRRGLPVGPWLTQAKAAIRAGMPHSTLLMIGDDATLALGDVRDVFRTGPGQKVAYVTDGAWTPENIAAITALARDADQLFIEAVFLEQDAALATMRKHLTATQAAQIAVAAGARHVTPFHHSPRYLEEPGALASELRRSLDDLRSGCASAPLETAAALGEPGDQDGA
jgi:ribonuclease Z